MEKDIPWTINQNKVGMTIIIRKNTLHIYDYMAYKNKKYLISGLLVEKFTTLI